VGRLIIVAGAVATAAYYDGRVGLDRHRTADVFLARLAAAAAAATMLDVEFI